MAGGSKSYRQDKLGKGDGSFENGDVIYRRGAIKIFYLLPHPRNPLAPIFVYYTHLPFFWTNRSQFPFTYNFVRKTKSHLASIARSFRKLLINIQDLQPPKKKTQQTIPQWSRGVSQSRRRLEGSVSRANLNIDLRVRGLTGDLPKAENASAMLTNIDAQYSRGYAWEYKAPGQSVLF